MATVGKGKYTYEVVEDWARLPEGVHAPMAAVTVDSQDRVYGFNRGERGVIVFDTDGNYLYSWEGVKFAFPHAIYADPHDSIWVVDRNDGLIMKFTPEGKLLMTIGEKGYRSDTGADNSVYSSNGYRDVTRPGGPFNLPAGIGVAPSGDIFIADGYANCQVHHFSPDGKLVKSWGTPGSGPGQFMLPHGSWVDSRGRVLIADRENNRVQVFSQEGEFLTQWPTALIGPAVVWEDGDGVCYVAEHNGGFFSVLTLDGELLARWGDAKFRSCHGAAGDSDGNIYFVQPTSGEGSTGRRIVKYIRKG
ncbi:MAG: 6-bladed beta-propeller [Chloroflexi bacterium]|nr:6-bladed beta-propeller [Chloroflexota bacterium]